MLVQTDPPLAEKGVAGKSGAAGKPGAAAEAVVAEAVVAETVVAEAVAAEAVAAEAVAAEAVADGSTVAAAGEVDCCRDDYYCHYWNAAPAAAECETFQQT